MFGNINKISATRAVLNTLQNICNERTAITNTLKSRQSRMSFSFIFFYKYKSRSP